jgi:tetratricopeptide (TPR) repeat protein
VFLNSLSAKAYLIADHHLLSIIYRQRSLVYKELFKYQAAIEDSHKALDLLMGARNHSDAQRVYLNLCDVYMDLNNREMAQLYFERLIRPIDPRHAFSVAYIHARINKLNEIAVSDFSFICPHYKKRATLRNIVLSVEESLSGLTDSERKLLVLLKESPRKKTDLVKLIWPERSNPKSLDNRLYQLIFRVNKKSSYKIQKSLGLYILASN